MQFLVRLTPTIFELCANHRVMEWLKEINLSEYALNVEGSGVHGFKSTRKPCQALTMYT